MSVVCLSSLPWLEGLKMQPFEPCRPSPRCMSSWSRGTWWGHASSLLLVVRTLILIQALGADPETSQQRDYCLHFSDGRWRTLLKITQLPGTEPEICSLASWFGVLCITGHHAYQSQASRPEMHASAEGLRSHGQFIVLDMLVLIFLLFSTVTQ